MPKKKEKYDKIMMVAMPPALHGWLKETAKQMTAMSKARAAEQPEIAHTVSMADIIRLGVRMVQNSYGKHPQLLLAELDKAYERERVGK